MLFPKVNLDLGIYTEVNKNLGLAFGVRSHHTKDEKGSSQSANAKFSLAYRPEGDVLVMNRLEYRYENSENSKVAKAIESFLCVVHPSENSTLSGHYGYRRRRDPASGLSVFV